MINVGGQFIDNENGTAVITVEVIRRARLKRCYSRTVVKALKDSDYFSQLHRPRTATDCSARL